MNKHTAMTFVLFILLGIISLLPSTALAKDVGAERSHGPCCETCNREKGVETNCLEGVSEVVSCPGESCAISNATGSIGETNPVFSTSSSSGSGIGLSFNYNGNNANGEVVSLDTVLGFGWSHSYNVFLFSQGRDLFKMDSTGGVTKFQRSGRSGALSPLPGTQQAIVEKADGSIVISNWQGGTTFVFRKITGNPLRIAGVEPWMLTLTTDTNGNWVQLNYQNGLLTEAIDNYNRHIKFVEYDANHHLTRVQDPMGRETKLEYGGYSNLTKIIDPLNQSVQYAYDVRHQIVRKTDKNGNQWNYAYNSTGHVVGLKDGAGNPVLNLSNPIDWATNASDLALLKLRTYIPSVTTRTDGLGKQWQYFYNSDGQVTKTVAPDNATTTYTYDPVTLNMASMTDANGHRTEYSYNSKGNLIRERRYLEYPTSNPGKYFDTVYDYYPPGTFSLPIYDRVKTITYANGSITEYQYDAHGNRIKETRDVDGLKLVQEWSYDSLGHVLTEKDPNGHTIAYEYDVYGNLTKVTDPEGHITRYEYNTQDIVVGNRTRTIDGNGHVTGYTYDDLDRLKTETDPLAYVTEYFYDGNGNSTQVRKQVTKAPDTFETTQYQYDLRNRLVKEIRDPGGLNLVTLTAYDNNDNRVTTTDPRGKTTSYNYDVQNRLSKVTDALTNITQYAYDRVGNRIQETDANSHKSCSQYDALNRLTVQIRKMGATSCALTASTDIVTRHFYDTGAAMSCDHDPGSPSCNGPTPGSSNIAYTIDPEGKYSYFKYDKVDRRWITIRKVADSADTCDGDDWCEFTKYDPAGNMTARIDANANRTNYSYYDNNWLKTETTDPGGLNLTTATIYDGVGNPKRVTNPRGNVITNTYDDRNQLLMVVDSIGKVAEYQYDGIGNRIVERDGNQGDTDPFTIDTPPVPETRYAYDAVNRLIKETDPLSNDTANGYDKNGNLIKVTDRESHVTCHYYDNINRRIRTAQLMGGSNCAVLPASALWTDTKYDAVGNVTRLITAKKNSTPAACTGALPPSDCETTRYQYDPADRLILETYADGTTRQFSYDQAGNLTERVDQLRQVTQYDYNDLYYLNKRDYQDAAEADDFFEYDTGGRMIRAERANWVVTFDDYDAANRLLQTTQDATGALMTVQYAYNTAAGTRNVSFPGGRVCNEQWDLRERLDDNTCDSFNAIYAYDLGNRVETRTYNNGITANYGYNANNWITSLTHTNGGTIVDFGYKYDKEGNKEYEQKNHDSSKSEAYAYDDVYRLIDYKVGELVGSTVPVPVTQHEYDLDKVGNWDQFTINGVDYQNTPNRMNEYDEDGAEDGIPDDFKDNKATPITDGEDWAHDDNGNRSYDAKRVYQYDDENRLIRVTRKADNVVREYQYDALSRRVVKIVDVNGISLVTTRFAYDDARIIEEQDGTAATLATYVYGNYIDEVLNMQRGGVDYYYHQNALWSVVAVTNAAAGVVESYAYTDYGCPSVTHSAIGNPWMFTGREWDEESGLYFYRARYYDCEAGRFFQRDPLGYVDGFNAYEYAKGNPVLYYDYEGLIVETPWDLINVGTGIVELGACIGTGNVVGALWAAGALTVDVVATLVPGVPAGASTLLQARKLGKIKKAISYIVAKETPIQKAMFNALKVNKTQGTKVIRYLVNKGKDHAHHILPGRGPSRKWVSGTLRKEMDQLRKRAKKLGFDLQSADNAVSLPDSFHLTKTTTSAYYQQVINAFKTAKSKEDFIRTADSLAQGLLKTTGKLK